MAGRIKIRGENWRIKIAPIRAKDRPGEQTVGLCSYERRTIYIHPEERNKRRCVRHEILHACLPDFEEEAIKEIELALHRGECLIEGMI